MKILENDKYFQPNTRNIQEVKTWVTIIGIQVKHALTIFMIKSSFLQNINYVCEAAFKTNFDELTVKKLFPIFV